MQRAYFISLATLMNMFITLVTNFNPGTAPVLPFGQKIKLHHTK